MANTKIEVLGKPAQLPATCKRYGTWSVRLYASEFCKVPSNCEVGERGNVRGTITNKRIRNIMIASAVDAPQDFPVRHNGVNVVCTGLRVGKTHNGLTGLTLTDAVVTNGQQTKAAFETANGVAEVTPLDMRITVAPDKSDATFVNMGISQNLQTGVKDISIVGHMGLLEPVEREYGAPITKCETDRGAVNGQHVVQKGLAYYGLTSKVSGNAGLRAFQDHVYPDKNSRKRFLDGVDRQRALEAHVLGLTAVKTLMNKGIDGRCLDERSAVIPFLFVYGGLGGATEPIEPGDEVDKAVVRVLRRNLKKVDNFTRSCTELAGWLREELRDTVL